MNHYPARHTRTEKPRLHLCADCDRGGWFTVTRYDGTGKTTACKRHLASIVYELSLPSPMKPGALVHVIGELSVGAIHEVRWVPGEVKPKAVVIYPRGNVRRIDLDTLVLAME